MEENELRFVVANCVVRRYRDMFTTTVSTTVDGMADFEVNQLIRQHAARQLGEMYAGSFDPRSVIVLDTEDTTYALQPGE